MTDRELLEAAVKPIWDTLPHDGGPITYYEPDGIWLNDGGYGPNEFWNPLTDDGDALRLAVKLDLSSLMIYQTDGAKRREFWSPNSGHDGGKSATTEAEYVADPCAATRRAIVRAAAEIGRNMK